MFTAADLKVTRVGMELGVTLSMGNYETARTAIYMEVEVPIGADPDEVTVALKGILEDKLWATVREQKQEFPVRRAT